MTNGAAATFVFSACDVAWFFKARRVVYAFGHLGHLQGGAQFNKKNFGF